VHLHFALFAHFFTKGKIFYQTKTLKNDFETTESFKTLKPRTGKYFSKINWEKRVVLKRGISQNDPECQNEPK